MLAIVSPSKSLDFESELPTNLYTQPEFLDQSQLLIDQLRGFDVDGLRELMSVSENLAELNVERNHAFETPFTPENARPAIFAFTGDVYTDFQLAKYREEDFDYVQDHLRILSGLYGLLRPLDLIQPYRLEMGTRLENERGKNLYEFWGERITDALAVALEAQAQGDEPILLNLASKEYFSSVDFKRLNARVVDVKFMDLKGDKYKTITFYLKRLRGTMVDWMVRNKVDSLEELKNFKERNYYFCPERSSKDTLVFLRDEKP
ncbi:peroxide stress protein YaaA [Bradymonas sediminis]|uniref:UPF0246 protein DN745_08915 n=1 Tax=Bradymonas sediminis TaxID=1548548 RepID=A0A2Z4FKN4_9DELT|nr:peroxide stress protein YaaA [Bradymonas sediminis]AWV89452.1 peroxide stress protein YaaA [Bradymonas sediminis]TDP76822.1 hypothetical protein DFR33_102459 [Bradymonas sediminis]